MVTKSYHHPSEIHPLIRKSSQSVEKRNALSLVLIVILFFVAAALGSLCMRRFYIDTFVSPPSYFQLQSTSNHHTNEYIYPGSIFYDIEGDPINAHGGGFLRHNNTYYWYGEIKKGKTYLPKSNKEWYGTRVDFVGISCYASIDLLNWRKCNTYNVLPAVDDDPSHDLHWSKVGERPKVVYNAKTEMFVMWLHVDTMDYQQARCGIATSYSPEASFSYIGSFQPEGQMARDLTVFVDDDFKAYLFTSSENNAVMHLSQLTDDYLNTSSTPKRIFVNDFVEAPTMFKKDGLYYFIGSGCTAWEPNAAKYAIAKSIWGPWNSTGNPFRGEDADTSFHSQSTFMLPVSNGIETFYMFAGDRWISSNLSDSRYVWLPVSFDVTNSIPSIEIRWQDHWRPDEYMV